MSLEALGSRGVADELWLMAHDVRGRSLVAERVLSLSLACALLGELVLGGYVAAYPDVLVATGRAPADRLAVGVYERIGGESQPPGRWLRYLALRSTEDVARRLEGDGLVRRYRSRLPGAGSRWVPVDSNVALTPGALLVTALTREEQMSQRARLLGALARESGLHRSLLRERWDPSAALAYLNEQVLGLRPDLLALVGLSRSLLAGAVLVSGR